MAMVLTVLTVLMPLLALATYQDIHLSEDSEVGCLSFCGETDFPIRWKWCYINYNHISRPMFQTPWKLL
jgi:hypothetical protein